MKTRNEYLEEIQNDLQSGRNVLVVGPPGIGKSELLKTLKDVLFNKATPATLINVSWLRVAGLEVRGPIGDGAMFWNLVDHKLIEDRANIMLFDDVEIVLDQFRNDFAFAVGLEHATAGSNRIVAAARDSLASPLLYGPRIAQVFRKFVIVPIGPLTETESIDLTLLESDQIGFDPFPNFSTLTAAASGGIPGVIKSIVNARPNDTESHTEAANQALAKMAKQMESLGEPNR